jgi:hypothetical protein
MGHVGEQASSEVLAEFVATIPPIQSAFNVSGEGSARLKLDLPESEIAEALKLIAFGRDRALRIVVYGLET